MTFKKITLFAFLSFIAHQVHALPTAEDTDNIVKICSGGKSSKIQAKLDFSLRKWITSFEGEAEASTSELGAIFNEIDDENIKKDIFSIYHDCAIKILKLDKELKIEEIKIIKKSSNTTQNGSQGTINNIYGDKITNIGEMNNSGSGGITF